MHEKLSLGSWCSCHVFFVPHRTCNQPHRLSWQFLKKQPLLVDIDVDLEIL